jgi:hypothetical protein
MSEETRGLFASRRAGNCIRLSPFTRFTGSSLCHAATMSVLILRPTVHHRHYHPACDPRRVVCMVSAYKLGAIRQFWRHGQELGRSFHLPPPIHRSVLSTTDTTHARANLVRRNIPSGVLDSLSSESAGRPGGSTKTSGLDYLSRLLRCNTTNV